MNILIYGAINGAIFTLIAMGFSLVYGVSRIANFAHGFFYILTGFVAWSFIMKFELTLPLAILLSVIICFFLGAVLYQGVMVRVRGMEGSEIIASFAVALVGIEGLKKLGFLGTYGLPMISYKKVEVLGVTVDFQRLIAIGTAGAVAIFLYFFTRQTKAGIALRAIAQDEQAAMMLGIDSDRTATLSLALGSALVAIAAVVILPRGNLYPEIGWTALIEAVAVCIVGGLGSISGTLIAGMVLGYAQTITMEVLGVQWHMVVLFLAIILILIFKPSGLMGKQKELEERV